MLKREEKGLYFTMFFSFFLLLFWRKGDRKKYYLGHFSYWITGFDPIIYDRFTRPPLNDKVTLLLSNHSEIMVCIDKACKTSNLIRLCQNTNFAPKWFSFVYYILNSFESIASNTRLFLKPSLCLKICLHKFKTQVTVESWKIVRHKHLF